MSQLGYEDARAAAHAAVGVPELIEMAKRNLSHGSHLHGDGPTFGFLDPEPARDHLALANAAANLATAVALERIATALEEKL